MASAKAIESWFQDLREGPPKKREAAARKLAALEPARARALLLEVLASAPDGSRRPISRSLHWVADVETARRIATDRSLTFMPERLAPAVLAQLYDDLRGELPTLGAGKAKKRLVALHALEHATAHAARLDADAGRREALVALLLAVLDDPRLIDEQAAAAEGLRRLDSELGSRALLLHWSAGSASVGGLSAYAAWVRLGCPALGTENMTRLVAALIDALSQAPRPETTDWQESSEDARLDAHLRAGIAHVPDALAIPLVVALVRYARLPAMTTAAASRVVALAADTPALSALLDDPRLNACHRLAAEALMERGPSAARAMIERGPRLHPAVRAAALAKAGPQEVYSLLVAPSTGTFVDESWYDVVAGAAGALRDARWLDVAPGLRDRGRALYVAIAQDPRNEARSRAVAMLSGLAAEATDRLAKRHALYALGETGHPAATTALVAALDDHDIGDSAPLICTALAKCGDTRAIPVLERRLRGPHAAFVQAAIARIRERSADIHASVLLAACQDDDPALADLARRARDGDTDAAVVLEDALRERGRL